MNEINLKEIFTQFPNDTKEAIGFIKAFKAFIKTLKPENEREERIQRVFLLGLEKIEEAFVFLLEAERLMDSEDDEFEPCEECLDKIIQDK